MSDSLYKLMVSISLKDATKAGFSDIQRNVENTAKKTKELQSSLDSFGKGIGKIFSSKGAQEEINNLSRKQLELRKQIATTTNSEQKKQLENELKAISLVKQEISIRKSEFSLQERISSQRISDINQAKRIEKADNAEIARMKRRDEAEARRAEAQAQKERLANLRQIEAEQRRYREQVRNQRSAAIEDRLNGLLASRSAAYEAGQARRAEIGGSLSLGAGLAAGAASGTILGGLKQGLGSAADMQTAMTTLQISTASSPSQMAGFQNLASKISDQTGQSMTDAIKNIAILAGAGVSDPNQLRQLAGPIAQFADIQFYKKGTSFEESAAQGVQLAHLYGAYTQDKIRPILEKLTQVSFAMPDGLSKFLTQAGYYEPIFKGLGVSDSDSIMAGAIIDRAGMGRGKGGTSLQNLILNQMGALAMTGHVQGKRKTALAELGLLDKDGGSKYYKWNEKDKRNEFDIIGALKQIDKSVKQIPEGLSGKEATAWQAKRIMAVNAAFGLTGERAALAITPEAISNLTEALGRINQSGGMDQIQRRYMGNLGAQEQRFKSNMDSLLTDLMWPWLDDLRKGFSWMGTEAHDIQAWAHTHRDAAKAVALGLAGIGSALAVYSGAQLLGVASGLRALSGAIQTIAAAEAIGGAGAVAGGVGASGGLAFGLGGEVLGGGAGFAATRGAGLVGGLAGGAAGIAVLSAFPAVQNYASTSRAPVQNENLVANVAQEWARLGKGRPDSIEPDGNGVILVQGDIHIHVPAGTEKQQMEAIANGLKRHVSNAASAKRHPMSRSNFSGW